MLGPAASALLAETRRKPGRLLLTGLAITVATVFAAGTVLFADTLRAYLTATSHETPPAAAVSVIARGSSSTDLTERTAAVEGVDTAVALWRGFANVSATNFSAPNVSAPNVSAPNVSATGGGTSWMVTSDPMGGPLSRLPVPEAGRLPTAPDEVVLTAGTAKRTGVALGARLTITGDDGPRTVTVTGIVTPLSESAFNTVIGFPQTVAPLVGSLQQIDVVARPGTDPDRLAQLVSAAVGDGAVVRTAAQQRAAEEAQASATVSAVLAGVGVFAGLALVAAAVVVASTFRIVLTQRRTQLALLRCVGASRRQVTRAVLAEAVVTGFVAGVLGAAVAVLAGFVVTTVVGAGGAARVPTLVVSWPALAGCVLVAVVATVAAALAPALAAARIPPVAALGAAGAGETGRPSARRRMVLAAALAACAAALAVLGLQAMGESVVATAVVATSGMVAFAALIAVGPALVRVLAGSLGGIIAQVGRGPGRLAVANARDVPRRTAAMISVLALGVGLTSALLVALAGVEADGQERIARNFPADVVVHTADAGAASALAQQLAGDPRVAVRATDSAVLVDPAPGTPETAARGAVEAAAAGKPGLLVQYAGDARAELSSTLGIARLIGFALVGMTALVAVVGVGVTLMLSVTERTRETGLLRAVGLNRRGVRAMVAWEAALGGVGAGVLGAVIGAAYGLMALPTVGMSGGAAAVPVVTLVGLVVGVVAVAVLAAVIPAVRAGRVPPIRALQEA